MSVHGPATIFVKGRFLTQAQTGVQRFAREVLSAIDNIASTSNELRDLRFVVLAPNVEFPDPGWKNIEIRRVGITSGQIWEQVELPLATGDHPLLTLSGVPVITKKRQISVLHDAAVFDAPGGYTKTFAAWYRFAYRVAARTGQTICTVSEFSRARLASVLRLPSESIHVSCNGADHVERIAADDEVFRRHPRLLGRPYVLSVGSSAPNKNFKLFAEAARRLKSRDVQFVVVGQTHGKVFGDSVESLDDILSLGYVSDAELKALYSRAACYVFPSLYEGFGIPALEAMACGCAVVASNAASLPEVCGDAALMFDPHSAEDLCKQIELVLGAESIRRELQVSGRRRAQFYTWSRSAKSLVNAIRCHLDPALSSEATEHKQPASL